VSQTTTSSFARNAAQQALRFVIVPTMLALAALSATAQPAAPKTKAEATATAGAGGVAIVASDNAKVEVLLRDPKVLRSLEAILKGQGQQTDVLTSVIATQAEIIKKEQQGHAVTQAEPQRLSAQVAQLQRELEQSKLRSEQLSAVGRIVGDANPAADAARSALARGDVNASVSYLEQVERAAIASSMKQMNEAASAARQRGSLLSDKDSAAARRAFERATEYEPDNPINWMLLGDVAMTLGDSSHAALAYQRASVIVSERALRDPQNTEWQRDLSVSYERIADQLAATGDGPGALASYRKGLAIAEKLATRDPQNTDWQRDLFVSYLKVGNTLVRNSSASEGLVWLERAHAVSKRLTQIDPSNAIWSRDLTIIEKRIAAVRAK
jgi:tetratricopeptide (TPR) repeat protein